MYFIHRVSYTKKSFTVFLKFGYSPIVTVEIFACSYSITQGMGGLL